MSWQRCTAVTDDNHRLLVSCSGFREALLLYLRNRWLGPGVHPASGAMQQRVVETELRQCRLTPGSKR